MQPEILHLPTLHLGRLVEIHPCLDSTSTLALERGDDPARHGTIVRARVQTGGRGQYGRVWQAPPDSSVLMSVLLFPPEGLRRPALLTAWAAVAVAEVVRELAGAQARIKWPNDVLVRGKKVCGILIEQRAGAGGKPATVAGIGLNVAQPPEFFEQAGLPLGGSLRSVAGVSPAVDAVFERLVQVLDAGYDALARGELHDLECLWKWRLGVLGRQVRAELADQDVLGRVLEVAFAGVEIRDAAGRTHRLQPEAIRHLVPLEAEKEGN